MTTKADIDPYVARVPQGGRLEYRDRDDAPGEVKQNVAGMLDRLGTVTDAPMHLVLLPWSWIARGLCEGFVSELSASNRSVLKALGHAVGAELKIEMLPAPARLGVPSVNVVFSRPGVGDRG